MIKKLNFGTKPTSKLAEEWVNNRDVNIDQVVEPVEENKRLTIDIPASIHRAFKQKVAGEGETMAEKVTLFIKNYLDED